MKEALLQKYMYQFLRLRRDQKNGGAPHKPVLLLSVLNGIEKGLITDSRVYVSPGLVGIFKSYWQSLVITNHTLHFTLPFYHMKSEPFWTLIANPGYEKVLRFKIRGIQKLTEAVAYAQIDGELFELMCDSESREILKTALLEHYFREVYRTVNVSGSEYIEQIQSDILEESGEAYRAKFRELSEKLDPESLGEEVFIRGGVFKREIPKIYDYTCCISGLRIDTTANASLIDACHIVPFSQSNDDTVTNGLALCPNLHRAFDRGLIAVDDNYRVITSQQFKESNSSYSIKQFEGKRIRLPENSKFIPHQSNFTLHREMFGNLY